MDGTPARRNGETRTATRDGEAVDAGAFLAVATARQFRTTYGVVADAWIDTDAR